MQAIHIKIKADLKQAMIAKDAVKLSVLRGLLANFSNEIIAKSLKTAELADEEALALIRRGVKQRKDSIEQFSKGGRQDLVANESAELSILETYLPQMMSKDQIRQVVKDKIIAMGAGAGTSTGPTGATSAADKSKAGQFIGLIMKELKGRADGADVKEVVDEMVSK